MVLVYHGGQLPFCQMGSGSAHGKADHPQLVYHRGQLLCGRCDVDPPMERQMNPGWLTTEDSRPSPLGRVSMAMVDVAENQSLVQKVTRSLRYGAER